MMQIRLSQSIHSSVASCFTLHFRNYKDCVLGMPPSSRPCPMCARLVYELHRLAYICESFIFLMCLEDGNRSLALYCKTFCELCHKCNTSHMHLQKHSFTALSCPHFSHYLCKPWLLITAISLNGNSLLPMKPGTATVPCAFAKVEYK